MRTTSIQSFKQIKREGLLSKRRFQVYEILVSYGPLTMNQMTKIAQQRHKMCNTGSFNTRLSELRDMGVAVEVGQVSCPISDRMVIQWDAIEGLPVKPKKKTTNKEMVIRYKKACAFLAKHVNEATKQKARDIIKGVK